MPSVWRKLLSSFGTLLASLRPGAKIARTAKLLCTDVSSPLLERALDMSEGNFSTEIWQGSEAFLFPASQERVSLAKTLRPIGGAWYDVDAALLPERNKAHSYSAKGGAGPEQAGQQVRSKETFEAGFTQVLGNMMPFARAAASVSEWLMAELGAPFSVNAYRAPQTGVSLCPHNDPQDVLILQLEGCRRWTVWSALPDGLLPLPFDRHITTSTIDCALLEEEKEE